MKLNPVRLPLRPLRTVGAPAVALLLAVTATACAADTDPVAASAVSSADTVSISVQDAWVRATRGTEDPTMTAAFMVIDNAGDKDVTLVAAASPVAGMAQLHEMAMVDGAMAMQEVDGGIVITAGRGKLLEPGGYHVMLMDLAQELVPGDEVELSLDFSDGSTQELTVPVKEFTEEEGHYHSPGTSEHAHTEEPSMEPSSS